MKEDDPGPRPEDQAWREAYRESMDPGSEDCPAEERLAALALRELAGDERQRVADHVTRCRRCAAAYALLRELDREAARRRPSRRAWAVGLASAAALVVGLAAVTQLRGPSSTAGDPLRGGAPASVHPSPGSVLSAPPDELAWPAPAGVSSYRVRLYRADGDLLWESAELAEPRLDLSSQALDRLAAGHAYFWTVEARGEGLPSRLGPFWFQVAGGR